MSPAASDYDLIVLGAGAAGMTAAVVAAQHGLATLLLEKSAFVGGTTAVSGGMVWVPNNHLMQERGLSDTPDAARAYLAATVPDAAARPGLEAYLAAAPEAIRWLTAHTAVQFQPVVRYPDYYPDTPGATLGGRVLEPVPFDAASLGDAFAWLRPPLPEFTLLGGMMVARPDIVHFRRFGRSISSTLRVGRLLLRHARERLRHPRGTSLVLGNALAGRLLLSARAAGVEVCRSVEVAELAFEEGRCIGVDVVNPAGGTRRIRSRRGVVLSTGGFSHDPQLRRRLMPQVADEASATTESARGDGLRLAEAHGAAITGVPGQAAFWVPVSRYRTRDGREVVYPHTVTDRGKPGLIAVDLTGRRFVNEAVSYHNFVRAMLASSNGAARRAFLVCDSAFIWRYGLGAVKPFCLRLQPFLDAEYLKRGDTIAALAHAIGVEAQALAETVRNFNVGAVEGQDPEFGRGRNAYERHVGDPEVAPNPNVAPIVQAPFYAVEVRPGDLGTAAGLATDLHARVLTADGRVLRGLYVAGNDAASVMCGQYPGPGITLGPALTFGYLAAMTAAAEARSEPA